MDKTKGSSVSRLFKTTKAKLGLLILVILLCCCACSGLCLLIYNNSEPYLRLDRPTSNSTETDSSKFNIRFECLKISKVNLNNQELPDKNICYSGYDVELSEGENKFIVIATDEKGNNHKIEFAITYKPKPIEITEQPKPEEIKPTEQPKVEETPKPTTTPQSVVIDRAKEKKQIEDRIKSADGSSQIDSITIIENIDGTYNANVYFELICASESGCLDNAKITSGSYYYEIFKNNAPKVTTATIAGKMEVTDSYGNDSKPIVFQSQLSSDIAEKINWKQDEATLQVYTIPGLWTQQKNSIANYF